ncbi:MAG: methionine biosynthesis protein MetW [Candidatus Omnitrophota bacterium]|jgi:methionine biosynthesis protein MetW
MDHGNIPIDHRAILELIEKQTSVLDLGCGRGELMDILIKEKGCRCQGIEIDENAVYECVARGLSVLHGDIDSGLSEYADNSFDYVVLNQSLQQLRHFDSVFKDALRVGRRVIVGLPNFAHYKTRLQLFFGGKAPVTPSLPYNWFDSPNVHFLSILDFRDYCKSRDARITHSIYLGEKMRILLLPNLLANVAIFLLKAGTVLESG